MNAKNPYLFPRPLPIGAFSPDECLAILEAHSGITLRDHFAGLAMQGDWAEGAIDPSAYKGRAEEYYAMADAMLKARKKS